MGIVIYALVNGDLQRMTKNGVISECLGKAFTSPSMDELKPVLSAKNIIVYDGQQWDLNKGHWKEAT